MTEPAAARKIRHVPVVPRQAAGILKDARAVAYQRLDHRLGSITPGELTAIRRIMCAFLDL